MPKAAMRKIIPLEATGKGRSASVYESGGQEFESLRARQLAHCQHNRFVQCGKCIRHGDPERRAGDPHQAPCGLSGRWRRCSEGRSW
jgi:hypothetical protein